MDDGFNESHISSEYVRSLVLFRTVVEEWLMHYRSSLGIILPPEVTFPEEPPWSCDVQSTGSSSIESEVITEGNDSILLRTLHSVRHLSAPVGQ